MKKALIVGGVVAVLGLVVFFSLRGGQKSGTVVEVEAAALRELSARVKATGEITPERKVEISAKVVGEVVNLPVHEGQQVAVGQILMQIEPEQYEAVRDQSRSALRQSEVAVRRLQVQLEDARRNLARSRQLHEQGLTTEQALDTAQLAVDTAEVELQAQRFAIEQAQSALQRATDDLARTTIRSPMDGRLIQLNVEQGETVVPGTMNLPGSVLAVVADMSRLLAEVEVNEVDIVNVALGQPAEVTVDPLGDEPLPGHVVEIATSGVRDPQQGVIRFAVKVALDEPNPALRPGMTAKVEVLTAVEQGALAVPIQAVVKRTLDEDGEELRGDAAKGRDQSEVVYVVEDGEARLRPVTTGISDELYVHVTSGLEADTPVITGPYRTLKSLRDGDEVRVEDRDADEEEADEDAGVTVEVS